MHLKCFAPRIVITTPTSDTCPHASKEGSVVNGWQPDPGQAQNGRDTVLSSYYLLSLSISQQLLLLSGGTFKVTSGPATPGSLCGHAAWHLVNTDKGFYWQACSPPAFTRSSSNACAVERHGVAGEVKGNLTPLWGDQSVQTGFPDKWAPHLLRHAVHYHTFNFSQQQCRAYPP